MIDIHVHLWDWRDTPGFIAEYMTSRGYFGQQEGESFFHTRALLAALDEGGVDLGVLLPLRSESHAWEVSNDYVARIIAEAPDRLIGFAGVSPLAQAATAELRHAIEGLGLRGLKLHPPMQMFDPGDARCFPVYALMQEYGLPVLFHTGSGPTQLSDRYSNPHLVDEVAVHFPRLKIVMAHAGRFWYQETLTMMRRHPNLYIDLSANVGRATGYGLLLALLVAVKEVVGDVRRVLFASDYPWYTPKRMLDLLRQAQEASRILPEPLCLTDEDIAQITDGNARRVLGLAEK
ncbi:MAG TPA: amidohydrolase family protein [Anaerolineae bacterium]|nr:amidohydrolase family protein [Anaerolineae bacterium]